MDCKMCQTKMLPRWQWTSRTEAEQAKLAADGWRRHDGRGLCRRCYDKAARAGTLPDFERTYVAADIVREEWQMHARSSASDGENYRTLAPRLGMTPKALEQAVTRLRRSGDLGAAA